MIKIHDVEQGSQEWHTLRSGKITGTSAKDLLIFGKKEALNRANKTFTGNYYTQRGHILEPQAIEIYEKIHDVDVLRVGFVTNSKYIGAGFSPDGICGNKLIEVKCFGVDRHYECSAEVPFEILAQVHFGMLITELESADIVFYNPDIRLEDAIKIVQIKRDNKILSNMEQKL